MSEPTASKQSKDADDSGETPNWAGPTASDSESDDNETSGKGAT